MNVFQTIADIGNPFTEFEIIQSKVMAVQVTKDNYTKIIMILRLFKVYAKVSGLSGHPSGIYFDHYIGGSFGIHKIAKFGSYIICLEPSKYYSLTEEQFKETYRV